MARKPNLDMMLNELTFFNIYNRLKNLALNIFKWEGLPDGVEQRYIERALYSNGKALFFQDPNVGFMCLPVYVDGGLNVYGEGVRYRATGHNYSQTYDIDNSVLIRNNHVEMNTHDYIMMFTNKLTEIERTMDVNVKAVKTPYIITCDDKDLLTFKNIFKQVDSNVPAIFADKNLNLNSIDVLETKAEFLGDKLADYRHDVTNEALTFLGINNANTDKRERLVTDEVNANNDYIEENVKFMLETRQQACEEINKMFGLSVSVKLRIETEQPKQTEGVIDDGQIHSGTEGTD